MSDINTFAVPPFFRSAASADQGSDPAPLTLDEAASYLGMSVKSVRRRIKAGVIRKLPLGGRLVRISADELRRLTTSTLLSLPSQDPAEDPDGVSSRKVLGQE